MIVNQINRVVAVRTLSHFKTLRGYPCLYPFYISFISLYCPFFISFLVTFPVMLILLLQGLSRSYAVSFCDGGGHSGVSFFVHKLLIACPSIYLISKGYAFFTVDCVNSPCHSFLGKHCQPFIHSKPLSINVVTVNFVNIFVNLGNPFCWKGIQSAFMINGHGVYPPRGRSLFILHELNRVIIDNGNSGDKGSLGTPPPHQAKLGCHDTEENTNFFNLFLKHKPYLLDRINRLRGISISYFVKSIGSFSKKKHGLLTVFEKIYRTSEGVFVCFLRRVIFPPPGTFTINGLSSASSSFCFVKYFEACISHCPESIWGHRGVTIYQGGK